MIPKKVYLGLFIISTFVFSCKKIEQAVETSKDVQMAQDNAQNEEYSDEVSVMADDAYTYGKLTTKGTSGGYGLLGDTVKVTRVDSVITIDFGTSGITSTKDGKTRKGKIKITFSNGYKKVGAMVTHTFENYYVDNNKIEGSRTITYNGLNASGNHNWSIESNHTITRASGKVSTWTSSRVRTMIAGANTPLNWSDDQYNITGSASGVTTLGDSYTINISTPLLVKVGCRYIQSGVINFTRGTTTASIDYSQGGTTATCENTALLTYNGTTKIITL